MKFLLAALLSFVLTEAPVLYARDVYGIPGASISLIGTYAGVFVPTADNLLTATATDFGANSLGLFTLSIPDTGIGSGTVIIFSNGRTFSGNIQALPDPANPGNITGIVNATFNYNLSGEDGAGNVVTIAVTANAQGSLQATAVQNPASVSPLGIDLDGTSQINVDQGFVSGSNGTPIVTEQITFAVDGFQQSNVATASTTTGT